METRREPLPEIAETEVSRRVARVFVAACLSTLLYMPLAQHVLPSGDERGLRAGPFAGFAASLAEMRAADADLSFFAANRRLKQHMDDFERGLEDGSHPRKQALPTVQWLLAAWGGVGNESVYLGDDGWLYLRTGFDYLTARPFLDPSVLKRRRLDAPAWLPLPEPDPRPAILDFQRQLADRGIHLLVLPTPTKAMVHPEPLAPRLGDLGTGLQNRSFAGFRAELERAGISVFDPAATLIRRRRETGGDQFLRTDSHWSPEGVDAVARELAGLIRELELPFTGQPRALRRQPQRLEGVGDLETGLRLPPWQKLYGPREVELQRVAPSRGAAEILLLGDSFANVYSRSERGWGSGAGLPEQLSYHLGRAVERLAVNDGGASGTRRRLADEMAAGRDRLAGKKLVIYQFAVRELAVGDWQRVGLPDIRPPS